MVQPFTHSLHNHSYNMIPQPFVKGAGDRVFFAPYEYPSGADIVFDFGNPLCTSAFGSNIVYNVGSLNVTGSLIPYNNPTPVYPTLTTRAGGVMVTRYIETIDSGSYLQWSGVTTEDVTIVVCSALNGEQTPSGLSATPNVIGKNSIDIEVRSTAALVYIEPDTGGRTILFNDTIYDTSTSNGRDGFNMIGVTSNGSDFHQYYKNNILIYNNFPLPNYTKPTSATQTFQLGVQSNLGVQCYLQYPKILRAKEIRQIYKVFSQRFFT